MIRIENVLRLDVTDNVLCKNGVVIETPNMLHTIGVVRDVDYELTTKMTNIAKLVPGEELLVYDYTDPANTNIVTYVLNTNHDAIAVVEFRADPQIDIRNDIVISNIDKCKEIEGITIDLDFSTCDESLVSHTVTTNKTLMLGSALSTSVVMVGLPVSAEKDSCLYISACKSNMRILDFVQKWIPDHCGKQELLNNLKLAYDMLDYNRLKSLFSLRRYSVYEDGDHIVIRYTTGRKRSVIYLELPKDFNVRETTAKLVTTNGYLPMESSVDSIKLSLIKPASVRQLKLQDDLSSYRTLRVWRDVLITNNARNDNLLNATYELIKFRNSYTNLTISKECDIEKFNFNNVARDIHELRATTSVTDFKYKLTSLGFSEDVTNTHIRNMYGTEWVKYVAEHNPKLLELDIANHSITSEDLEGAVLYMSKKYSNTIHRPKSRPRL